MKALIVDDEPGARSRMRRLLSAHPDIEVVGEACDGVEALGAIATRRPEVVFLDIQMPGLTGLEVARALGEGGPAIVFATAYDEHAISAFEVAAVDYLMKPISKQRLADALIRLRRRPSSDASRLAAALDRAQRPTRMAVRCGARFVVIDLKRVVAIRAQDHYATITCGDEEHLSDEPLSALIDRLDPETFIRVHRSAIINIEHLTALERTGDRRHDALLDDGTRVPVSRDRAPDLKRRLGLG